MSDFSSDCLRNAIAHISRRLHEQFDEFEDFQGEREHRVDHSRAVPRASERHSGPASASRVGMRDQHGGGGG